MIVRCRLVFRCRCALALADEFRVFGDHLGYVSLRAVLRLIGAHLNRTVKGDLAALDEILADELSGLPPCDYRQKVSLILPRRAFYAALYSDPEVAVRDPVLRSPLLDVRRDIPDQDDSVHFRPP